MVKANEWISQNVKLILFQCQSLLGHPSENHTETGVPRFSFTHPFCKNNASFWNMMYQLAYGKPNKAPNIHCSVTTLIGTTAFYSTSLYTQQLGVSLPVTLEEIEVVWASASSSLCLLDQFEALCVKAVPLPAGHRLQQSLLFLGAARWLQLVHSGQVEEDTLMEVECRVLLHQALQLAQGLLQLA